MCSISGFEIRKFRRRKFRIGISVGNATEVNTRKILCADPKKRNAGTVAGWDTISLCALLNLEKVLTENKNLKSLSPILVMERSQLLEAQYKAQDSLGVLGKRTSGCKLPGL